LVTKPTTNLVRFSHGILYSMSFID